MREKMIAFFNIPEFIRIIELDQINKTRVGLLHFKKFAGNKLCSDVYYHRLQTEKSVLINNFCCCNDL